MMIKRKKEKNKPTKIISKKYVRMGIFFCVLKPIFFKNSSLMFLCTRNKEIGTVQLGVSGVWLVLASFLKYL